MSKRMDEQVKEMNTSLAALAAPGESREHTRQELWTALAHAVRAHDRAAVIVMQVSPNYSARAQERVRHALEQWQRARSERLHVMRFARERFALVIAPIGFRSHARALAEQLTRSLDPRICPLLRRALPYAWFGVALHPDDGPDAESLLVQAEQALEHMRRGGARSFVLSRRRPVGANGLRPLALR
jgi:predicted signal transduction protein with EAL and GGDEF domain